MRSWTALLALAVVCGGVYYWQRGPKRGAESLESVSSPSQTPVSQPSAPPIHYPVPEVHAQANAPQTGGPAAESGPSALLQKPVPALDESDSTIEQELAKVFGAERLKLIVLKDVIRRVVVTVENAGGKRLPQEFSPVVPAQGTFMTTSPVPDGETVIDPANYARYKPYVEFAQAMDLKKVASTYIRFYPLFQSAYSDLGNKGYFNDRVIEVIDSALDTPDVADPVRLAPTSVTYKFADPQIEALTSAQKVLIRIGRENAAQIKTVLKQLRAKLVSLHESDAE